MVLFYRSYGFATKGLILVARDGCELRVGTPPLSGQTQALKGFSPGFYVTYIFTTIASIIEYTDMGDK